MNSKISQLILFDADSHLVTQSIVHTLTVILDRKT